MGKLTKEEAKRIPILDVARSLGMELKRSSPTEHYWIDHDSLKMNTKKNNWRRYSTGEGGDTISLVEYVKGISYRQAMDFLETGDYETSYQPQEEVDSFTYFLEPYEKPFEEARDYLKTTRGLSDETIDYFYQKGLLAQAIKRSKDGYHEEVLVFKHFDKHKQLVGASLQGIVADKERYEGKGYLKQIMFASQGIAGLSVDIGNPKRLVFTEAPIDLMSYYERNKDQLKDVRLVAMEGLKEGTVSRYTKELLQELGLIKQDNLDLSKLKNIQSTADFLGLVAEKTEFLTKDAPKDLITLAVDNDKAGRAFVERFQTKNIPVQIDLPPLAEGEAKMDWNDLLQREKGEPMTENYRLKQARASLEREKQKLGQEIDRAFAHQRQTNGQPMNDKRGGASFMKQHQQIEANISTIQAKIKAKEERIERLEHQEHLKSLGLNKTGSGLEMSVRNIPRIREEIEKASRGESFYTATTIRRYKEELERLEKIQALSDSVQLTKGAEALIESGQLTQWQKQPSLYFVKGQRGLALELSEEGVFTIPKKKYIAKNSEQATIVKGLLEKQDTLNDVKTSVINASQQETPELFVRFDGSESPRLRKTFIMDSVIPYNEFVSVLYEENRGFSDYGYYKTYFELQDEQGQPLVGNYRYDIGSEQETISETLVEVLPEPYLEIAKGADQSVMGKDEVSKTKATGDSFEDMTFEWVKNGKLLFTFDKNGREYPKVDPSSEDKKKSPEQDVSELDNTGGELFNRNSSSLGEVSPRTAPQPDVKNTQPDFPASNYFNFTTNTDSVSNNYRRNMRRLNKFASNLRESARWYLKEMAGTTMNYVYMTEATKTPQILSVYFDKKNWMHLTGITPVYKERVDSLSESFIEDVANGNGHFEDLKFGQGVFDKLKVINLLPEILESDTFVFNDLSNVEKFHNLDLTKALNPDDSDLLLLFKEKIFHHVPASLMRIKGEVANSLKESEKNTILGVYRERDGQIEQLSINPEFVKDGGLEMMSILQNRQYEEVKAEELANETLNDSITEAMEHNLEQADSQEKVTLELTADNFTPILDTAYNLGVPSDLESVPDDYKPLWEAYQKLADKHDGNLSAVIAEAEELGLIDKNSDFYKEWSQDNSYHNHYHVRINRIESPNEEFVLPFKEGQLLDYTTFVSGLYESNYDYFKQRQHSSDDYLPYAKVTFGLYAPEGVSLVEGVRYDVGDERIPISHIVNLGEHQDVIASVDEAHFRSPEEEEVLVTNLKDAPNKVPEMTDLLDSIYHLGVDYFVNERPRYNTTELKDRLDLFFERYEALGNDLSKTIDSFIKEGAVNLDSGFYEDWKEDVNRNTLDTPKEETVKETMVEETPPNLEDVPVKVNPDIRTLLDKKDDKELSKFLEEGISEFRNSEKYKQFLMTMSKFHKYSFRNVQLLLAQKPDVSQVASFNKWKKDFGRFVNKGEKSLKVFAPIQIIKRDKKGEPVLDERGEPTVYHTYKLVPVFDVSQTSGKELPKYLTDLKGTPEGYNNLFRSLREVSEDRKIPISFRENVTGAKGYYDPNTNEIVIRKGLSKAQTLKTIIHEMAHSDLHNKEKMADKEVKVSHAELQAESVAFVVSAYYGFDTSSYSMPYLNAWLSDKVALTDLKEQLETVQLEAKDLITRIDKCLEKYQTKEQSQDKFAEKLAAAERAEALELGGLSDEKKHQSSQTLTQR